MSIHSVTIQSVRTELEEDAIMDILAAVEECHRQERIERDASTAAADSDARDRHFVNAERHADQAWSLMEKLHDLNAVEYASTQPAAPPVATTE